MAKMDKKLLSYIKEGKYIKFYKSREWRKARAEVMRRDNYECQKCKDRGEVTVGNEDSSLHVHHIVHLKDNPLLGLDKNNLITLCASCHDGEHPEKLNKNKKINKINIPERW
ncbi:HNH endonuclease [Anaerosalibacter bizertensis]|uniref:HNH endonuclease n=1 Tax=Anaerosalibacter bizertensis TaxID=932217 RepID=UPI001C0F2806|nr:HNH endonuclease signature motif containing protein [Anaerosalibacter bizertensis]MBU5292814.1 HNH endonuclease [Anaerosalibacter bizertensis]